MPNPDSRRRSLRPNRNRNRRSDDCDRRGIVTNPDYALPFFAYGIFKPGEIAYSNIKRCIEGEPDEIHIKYHMKQRDGVPILLPEENDDFKTIGYLFHFNDNEKAYDKINEIISNELYEWGVINIGTENVNVLFGKCPELGSDEIENGLNRNDKENYKGKHDLLFDDALKLIRKNLKTETFYDENGFLKLQMNYMLLWSAIQRYGKLKYNKGTDGEINNALSEEEEFGRAIDKITEGKEYRTIYTSDGLETRRFNRRRRDYIIKYYYTLRCNIVHRGKTSKTRDIPLLKQATEDLLDIFEHMLKFTFNEK